MAGKMGKTAVGGAHTAGIYADMTVDGPEIGTLVVIVDRAKNLPNRKTMGKQNPYCAARLGKEAKKTETDKRGGQTPKWDQEMRFTVHDSPDYFQLKVSVFNDDKKTELIGETWVALESIVIPGGGQNDVWHNLNCKGRYAGEIRIELTYYDTRPREEKAAERRQSAPIDGVMTQSSSGVGGPRQPKPVKRRPLPADPTDSSQSSPLPYTPPSNTQERYVESPDDYGFEPTPPTDRRHERLQNGQGRGSPVSSNQQQQQQQQLSHSGSMSMPSIAHQPPPSQSNVYQSADSNNYRQEYSLMLGPPSQNGHPFDQPSSYESEYIDDGLSRPLIQPLQETPGMVHSHSSPAMIDTRSRQNAPHMQTYPGSTLPKSYSYEDSPVYQHCSEDGYGGTWPNTDEAPIDDQEAPPPPPVHRNSGSRPSPQSQRLGHSEHYAPIPATAPLNIRNGRGSIPGSPLSQIHSNPSHSGYPVSASPSNSQPYSQMAPSTSSHTSYSQIRQQRSISPIRDYGESVPPSLMPGYEPSIAADESERIMHENRMSARHHDSDPPRPQYQQVALPIVQARPQPIPRNVEKIQQRRPHRSSAPIINPKIASPNPQTPMRKSVSPQPGLAPTERHSEMFSPDSFDAFNPSLSAASSVNESGAKYNTPEQAKEASHQHERQEKLGDGPIIGNDGRIIDPSDHLPTDTWAPEPEQKAPRKGPQVTMRFRHSPQGAQPMPAARRPTVEHTVSTPIYAHSPENASPNSAGRARLQKKSRVAMGQPVSSPLVPTLNTTPRSSPLRPLDSTYPLQERENYGGYGSSPTYGRPSPGNIPPPLPGKIPIGRGQEDWDNNALSEEMKRIDIGVGDGQGRQRRSRYGL